MQIFPITAYPFHVNFSWTLLEILLFFKWPLEFLQVLSSIPLEIPSPQPPPPVTCLDLFWSSPLSLLSWYVLDINILSNWPQSSFPHLGQVTNPKTNIKSPKQKKCKKNPPINKNKKQKIKDKKGTADSRQKSFDTLNRFCLLTK